MDSESANSEFLALVSDIREQLDYFRELGVEAVETECLPNNPAKQAVGAEEQQPKHQVWSHEAARERTAPTITAAAAARKTTISAPPTNVSRPPNTLFGDLSPAPAIIQKSSESFEDIWADIGDCTRCPLYQGRTNIVHTEGNRNARLMFVGEAPGADEDAQARPFVGRAGQLLTKIIEAIGLKREEVLIGNVNRCRPPANRAPTQEEASMCKPFLLREIASVQPEIIVVMGNTAMKNLLETKEGITRARGQFQDYQGVKVMPTFHPAYLLRDPSKKQETWQDLKKVRDYLDTTPKRES
jgi:uracil-DNA glycosylase